VILFVLRFPQEWARVNTLIEVFADRLAMPLRRPSTVPSVSRPTIQTNNRSRPATSNPASFG
jgi:hypothetical protein